MKKKGKRGNGEGSLYQRASDKRWVGAITLEPVDGKRRRKVIYGATRKEVAEQMKVLLREQQAGTLAKHSKHTVASFSTVWLDTIVKPSTRPLTYRSYSFQVKNQIVPALGPIPLARLTPQDVQAFLAERLQAGLAPIYVAGLRMLLGSMLKVAMQWQLVSRNVALLTERPRTERFAAKALSPDEARRFLAAADDDRLKAFFWLALGLGLRRGELLGLRWQDVDLEGRTLGVEHTMQSIAGKRTLVPPKTNSSRRTVPLFDDLVAVLREHRAQQRASRLLAGASWVDTDLVFTAERGGPLPEGTVHDHFKQLLQAAGLPNLRLHDLRHSCASLLAAQGVPQPVVMAILGHASIQMTTETYTHVYDETRHQAARAMGEVFREGK